MISDRPTVAPASAPALAWGSDAMAEAIARCSVPFLALTPGSSYRGLHDSIVNYLGNDQPTMLTCLHEEHAVAVAHGYAKVTGAPMAVALHSNVGLMHATMAIYNAYCDRVPMLILGATGPLDAPRRRPWIDWVHTSADQAALIRPYTKWDDQPISVEASVESIYRANALTRSYPCAPTYVCLDVSSQEAPLPDGFAVPDAVRFPPFPRPVADGEQVIGAANLLTSAKRPLLLIGRGSRDSAAWRARVALAERLGAGVLTDLKAGGMFPTRHRLHPAAPSTFLSAEAKDLLRSSDVFLALDWIDLGGTLREAFGIEGCPAKVIACTFDHALSNGWAKDHFSLPTVDLAVGAHPDELVARLVEHLGNAPAHSIPGWPPPQPRRPAPDPAVAGDDQLGLLAAELMAILAGTPHCLVRLPLAWRGEDLAVDDPLEYLGQDGGGGLGSGPGMAVGAALALDGSGRLPVAVLGDGDFLMGCTALWTAAHHRLPLLVIVANNCSYFNDEVHQERVALTRGRPVANRWIGQHIREPVPDVASLARSLGLLGYGPVTIDDLRPTLSKAVADVKNGNAVVVDVHIATA